MYSSASSSVSIIIGLIIFLLIYLVLRYFNCWYWKINRRVEQNDEIIRLLKELNEKLGN